MIIQKLYDTDPKLAGEIINYLKNTLNLPAELIKSHDTIVVAIIEDYFYNHLDVMIVVDPKMCYVYYCDVLVYSSKTMNFTSIELKKDLIMYSINNILKSGK